VTSRDYGAAQNMVPIIKNLLLNKDINLIILAQNPAFNYFKNKNLNPILVSDNEVEIEKYLNNLFSSSKQDIVLTGLSGFNVGIDEIILKCNSRAITFTLQDYWGDVNGKLQVYADYYFVIDKKAALITKRKTNKEVFIMGGLPKYFNIKYHKYESKKRNNKKIIVFFGQPLWSLHSYRRVIKDLAYIGKELKNKIQLIYKVHPAEKNILKYKYLFNNMTLSEVSSNQLLYVADLSLSINSTCGFDNVYLQKYTNFSLSKHAFILYKKDLRKFFYKNLFSRKHPLSMQGLVIDIGNKSELYRLIKSEKIEHSMNNLKKDIFLDSNEIILQIEKRIIEKFKEKESNEKFRQ